MYHFHQQKIRQYFIFFMNIHLELLKQKQDSEKREEKQKLVLTTLYNKKINTSRRSCPILMKFQYAKMFQQNMQMIKIQHPTNEQREHQHIGTMLPEGVDKERFLISCSKFLLSFDYGYRTLTVGFILIFQEKIP